MQKIKLNLGMNWMNDYGEQENYWFYSTSIDSVEKLGLELELEKWLQWDAVGWSGGGSEGGSTVMDYK